MAIVFWFTMAVSDCWATEYDTTSGDVTLSENLTLSDTLDKKGSGTLYLTGRNTFGGDARIYGGTLQADFGQGLDANYAVQLLGGALSSASGSITASFGTGPGQIAVVSSITPRFTAKGCPLALNFGDGATLAIGTAPLGNAKILFNTAEADDNVTLLNPVHNATEVTVDVAKNIAFVDGDWTGGKTLTKAGNGTLWFRGETLNVDRLNANLGTTILDGSGPRNIFILNVLSGGTLAATNQTVTIDSNVNIQKGNLYFTNCTITQNNGRFLVGVNNGTATPHYCLFDGGAITFKETWVGLDAATSPGTMDVMGNAAVSMTQCFVKNGILTIDGGEVSVSKNDHSFFVGTSGTGLFVMKSGSLTTAGRMYIGGTSNAGGYGVQRQSGGTISTMAFYIGWTASSTGEVFIAGGELRQSAGPEPRVGYNGVGSLFVGESGTFDVSAANNAIAVADQNGSKGSVLLSDGGTIVAKGVNGRSGESSFTFNGGTLRASENAQASDFVTGLDTFAMSSGGGVLDSNGRDVTFAQPITAGAGSAELTHRWSFNGDLTDSVGGQTATATGTEYTNDGKSIRTFGNGSSYVDLGKNVLPSDGSAVTIEFWATSSGSGSPFPRMFETGKDGRDNIAIYWNDSVLVSVNGDTDTYRKNGQIGPFTSGVEFYYAMVIEPLDDSRWQVSVCKKDVETGETLKETVLPILPAIWSLPAIVQDFFYLGRGSNANRFAAGVYNEVRVWRRALTASEMTANVLAGPDALLGNGGVFVKRGAGTLTLTGANTYAIDTRVEAGTLALSADAALPVTTTVSVGMDTTLALGGNTQTVAGLTGSGTVSEGTLTVTGEINPGTDSEETATLTLAGVLLGGGTITLDATAEGVDTLVNESGTLDLSKMALEVRNLSALPKGGYVIVASPGGVSGRFASVSLSEKTWAVTYAPDGVHLAPSGLLIMVR